MNSRRQFLKIGVAGAAGLALGGITTRSGIVIAQEAGTLVTGRNLFADAGMVGEFNGTLDQVIAPTWWDVTPETKPLVGNLPSGVSISYEEVLQWMNQNVPDGEEGCGCVQPVSPYAGMSVVEIPSRGVEIR